MVIFEVVMKYLIVGINAAGFYAVEKLRELDKDAEITAVNGEPFWPYKRTKVNKSFVPGALDVRKFLLAEETWYRDNRIDLFNGTRVIKINPEEKTAALDSGIVLPWDKILIATGASPFSPPGELLEKSLSVRSYKDAVTVQQWVDKGGRVLIYGLGIEAVETAGHLRTAGLDVTLAGRGASLLSRYFSPPLESRVRALLTEAGISVFFGVLPEGLSRFSYDYLLHSTGVVPRAALARDAGLNVSRGIMVDNRMRTSEPDIYAAGDCAELKTSMVTDHWHSAQDQGRTAAINMAGGEAVWPAKKYRLKMDLLDHFFFSMRPFQSTIPTDFDVVDSVLDEVLYRRFYYKDGKLAGVEMMDDKDRAMVYSLAVNESWSPDVVAASLG